MLWLSRTIEMIVRIAGVTSEAMARSTRTDSGWRASISQWLEHVRTRLP